MSERLKREDFDVLNDLGKVFGPLSVIEFAATEFNENESVEAIERHSKVYGVSKKTRIVDEDEHGERVDKISDVDPMLDADGLISEWLRLKPMITGTYSKLSPKQLCKRIMIIYKDVFPNFHILAAIALCMQLKSVECERSFSTQNCLKNKYRASLGAKKLDILLKINMLDQQWVIDFFALVLLLL